jgi:hypothetical protein
VPTVLVRYKKNPAFTGIMEQYSNVNRMSPINPTPRPYFRVTWICTLGHVGGGNKCGGDTCRGLLQHMLANRAQVYPSQGGKYHAEGCMVLE